MKRKEAKKVVDAIDILKAKAGTRINDLETNYKYIKAFGEGKTIEFCTDILDWDDGGENIAFCLSPSCYRIKTKPQYRPVKTLKEADKFLGWEVADKVSKKQYEIVGRMVDRSILYFLLYSLEDDDIHYRTARQMYDNFYDCSFGKPVGIKEHKC